MHKSFLDVMLIQTNKNFSFDILSSNQRPIPQSTRNKINEKIQAIGQSLNIEVEATNTVVSENNNDKYEDEDKDGDNPWLIGLYFIASIISIFIISILYSNRIDSSICNNKYFDI